MCTFQTDLLRHAAHILAFLGDVVLKVAALDFFPQFAQRHIEIEAADDFCRRRVFLLTQSHGNGLIVHFFAVRFQHNVFHCFGKLVVIARPIVLAQNHQRAVAEFYRLDFLTFGQIGHDAVNQKDDVVRLAAQRRNIDALFQQFRQSAGNDVISALSAFKAA